MPLTESAWDRFSVPTTRRVISYLCNYIPIFSVNLSYGTQLRQTAEYLIQLKQRQEKIITEQTDCPGLCMASAPCMALQPKALVAAEPGVGTPGPALAMPGGALQRLRPPVDALSDLHARPLPPPAVQEPGRLAASTPCPQPRGSPPKAARAEGSVGCLLPRPPCTQHGCHPPGCPKAVMGGLTSVFDIWYKSL